MPVVNEGLIKLGSPVALKRDSLSGDCYKSQRKAWKCYGSDLQRLTCSRNP